MNRHYAAFIRYIESKGATREMFESELLNNNTSIKSFIAHLVMHLEEPFVDLWGCGDPGKFFRFYNALHDEDFWSDVFVQYEEADEDEYVLTEEVLKPFYIEVLSTEQVFALFLKKHRKFSIVKKDIDKNTVYSPYTLLYYALNQDYADKWLKLYNSFAIDDTISGARLLAIR
jgi:hypothetical protein